jgi:DNA-binding IclR family transcriptional regulator
MRNATSKRAEPTSEKGGVTAVARALCIMEAFAVGESTLSLSELSRRVGMHKTTALRLARTLALSQYMVQTEDSQWRLGPAAGWLGARYQSGFDVNNVVEPALHQLVKDTGESASFYVREGDIRSCVARVEGPQSVRHNVRVGERLPLDRGAPGRVILAFSGASGEPYQTIRERGYHVSVGEREAEVASVAAPVFDVHLGPGLTTDKGEARKARQGCRPRGQPALICAGRQPVDRDAGRSIALASLAKARTCQVIIAAGTSQVARASRQVCARRTVSSMKAPRGSSRVHVFTPPPALIPASPMGLFDACGQSPASPECVRELHPQLAGTHL